MKRYVKCIENDIAMTIIKTGNYYELIQEVNDDEYASGKVAIIKDDKGIIFDLDSKFFE